MEIPEQTLSEQDNNSPVDKILADQVLLQDNNFPQGSQCTAREQRDRSCLNMYQEDKGILLVMVYLK